MVKRGLRIRKAINDFSKITFEGEKLVFVEMHVRVGINSGA